MLFYNNNISSFYDQKVDGLIPCPALSNHTDNVCMMQNDRPKGFVVESSPGPAQAKVQVVFKKQEQLLIISELFVCNIISNNWNKKYPKLEEERQKQATMMSVR